MSNLRSELGRFLGLRGSLAIAALAVVVLTMCVSSSPAQAMPQTCGGIIRYGERLTHYNHAGWPECDYFIVGQPGDQVEISVDVIRGAPTLEVILYDGNSPARSTATRPQGGVGLSATLEGSGPYYRLRITSVGNPRTYGTFRVTLAKSGSASARTPAPTPTATPPARPTANPMIILYEGNNCTQDTVGIITSATQGEINFKWFSRFENDEARSLRLKDIGYGNLASVRIKFFDDPDLNRGDPDRDDYILIETKGQISDVCIGSFEPNPKRKGISHGVFTYSNDAQVKIEYYYRNNLDGKVSSMDVDWYYFRRIQ